MDKISAKSPLLSPFLFLGIILTFHTIFLTLTWNFFKWEGPKSTYWSMFLQPNWFWILFPMLIAISAAFASKSPATQVLLVLVIILRIISSMTTQGHFDDGIIRGIQSAFGIYGEENGFPFLVSYGFSLDMIHLNLMNLLTIVEYILMGWGFIYALTNLGKKATLETPQA